jgi:hypothetical protein
VGPSAALGGLRRWGRSCRINLWVLISFRTGVRHFLGGVDIMNASHNAIRACIFIGKCTYTPHVRPELLFLWNLLQSMHYYQTSMGYFRGFWGQCGREEATLRKRGRLEVDLESNSIDLSLAESTRCRVDFKSTSSRLDSAATLAIIYKTRVSG